MTASIRYFSHDKSGFSVREQWYLLEVGENQCEKRERELKIELKAMLEGVEKGTNNFSFQ